MRVQRILGLPCAVVLCGSFGLLACGGDDTQSNTAETTGVVSFEDWSAQASEICAEFADSLTASADDPYPDEPFVSAARELSALEMPTESSAEELVAAMDEAARARTELATQVEETIPSADWYMTEDGTVYAVPPGEPWFLASSQVEEIPAELGQAVVTTGAELEAAAETAGLSDCSPMLDSTAAGAGVRGGQDNSAQSTPAPRGEAGASTSPDAVAAAVPVVGTWQSRDDYVDPDDGFHDTSLVTLSIDEGGNLELFDEGATACRDAGFGFVAATFVGKGAISADGRSVSGSGSLHCEGVFLSSISFDFTYDQAADTLSGFQGQNCFWRHETGGPTDCDG